VKNTKCRIDTVISPVDGHSHPKHVEKRNKHAKKNCAPSWLYLQDHTRMHGQQNIKFMNPVLLASFQTEILVLKNHAVTTYSPASGYKM
jgi:hypothetical protein